MTLLSVFDHVAALRPDHLALSGGAERLSYAQLQRRANDVARALLARGVTPGQLVAVSMPRSVDAVVAVLGILRVGAAYVPIDPAYPAERQQWMAENARVAAILTARHLAPAPEWVRDGVCIDVSDLAQDVDAPLLPAPPTAPEDLLYILYTSGSTGRPKGVCGTHGATLNRLRWAAQTFPLGPDEVVGHRSSLSFVDAGPELFSGLLHGCPTAVISPDELGDLARLVAALQRHRVTRLTVVPSLLAALLRGVPHLGEALPLLRTWTTSGEELPLPLLHQFRQACPAATLLNLYGTTEITGDVTCAVFAPDQPLPTERVPLGHAIAHAELLVLDPEGQAVPDGDVGELYVGGPVLARGYHHSPQEQSHRFPSHPNRAGERVFRTGDRVCRGPSGALEYLGRVDNQVKIRGVRVELEEIERTLRAACPELADVAAVLLDGDRLVAAVAPADAALEPVRLAAERLLPGVMRPYRFVALPSLPLLPNGKCSRRALMVLLAVTRRALPEHLLPASPREREVAAVWSALLQQPELSVQDSFASLGGSSLSLAEAMLAYSRLQGGHPVPMGLARDGTLADVARALDGLPPLSPSQASDHAPLTLTPLSDAGTSDDDVVALLTEASHDPAISASTELPGRMTPERARAYAVTNEGVVIRLDGRPIGAGIVQRHPNVGEGVEVPSGAVQLDEWLLPAYRGRGLLSEVGAWPLLAEWLAARFDVEVSVVWEDHLAMLAILRARGYTRVGRSYWKSLPGADVAEGWCEVWLYDLRAHRATATPLLPL